MHFFFNFRVVDDRHIIIWSNSVEIVRVPLVFRQFLYTSRRNAAFVCRLASMWVACAAIFVVIDITVAVISIFVYLCLHHQISIQNIQK